MKPANPDTNGDAFPKDLNEESNRRLMPRKSKSHSVAVIPILLDGGPGDLQWADATTEDVSATGLSLTLDGHQQLQSRAVVIGATSASGGRAFATLQIIFSKTHGGMKGWLSPIGGR